jgi:hypothetical protein
VESTHSRNVIVATKSSKQAGSIAVIPKWWHIATKNVKKGLEGAQKGVSTIQTTKSRAEAKHLEQGVKATTGKSKQNMRKLKKNYMTFEEFSQIADTNCPCDLHGGRKPA